jgi:membrane peptidoglycan carboxypeptidase
VTTFRPAFVNSADYAVRRDMDSLDPQANPADQNVHIGLAAVDTTTGAVVGLYGGADYPTRGYNDATQAAGPTGSAIGTVLADGVDDKPMSHWPAAIADLGTLGVTDANPKQVPPSDDDITATPLAAATAYQAELTGGIVYQPYTVSQVLYRGKVIWHATPTALVFPHGDRGRPGWAGPRVASTARCSGRGRPAGSTTSPSRSTCTPRNPTASPTAA